MDDKEQEAREQAREADRLYWEQRLKYLDRPEFQFSLRGLLITTTVLAPVIVLMSQIHRHGQREALRRNVASEICNAPHDVAATLKAAGDYDFKALELESFDRPILLEWIQDNQRSEEQRRELLAALVAKGVDIKEIKPVRNPPLALDFKLTLHPLIKAMEDKDALAIQILLEEGMSVGPDIYSYALYNRSTQVLEHCHQQNVQPKPESFEFAVIIGIPTEIKYCMKIGVMPNTTILHFAIIGDDKKLVQYCMDHEVAPDAESLYYAIREKNKDCVEYCESHGVTLGTKQIEDAFKYLYSSIPIIAYLIEKKIIEPDLSNAPVELSEDKKQDIQKRLKKEKARPLEKDGASLPRSSQSFAMRLKTNDQISLQR